MAYIIFNDRTTGNVNAVKGRHIWEVLNGQTEPDDDAEAEYCARVHKIYLNWRNAPDDYIEQRKDILFPMVAGKLMALGLSAEEHGKHTSTGEPTRPEPGNAELIAFCEKWGLVKNGRITNLATKYFYGR